MSALLDSLLQENAGTFELPGPRSEAWRSTSLRALERRTFAPAPTSAVSTDAIAHIPAPRLVLVNGVLDAALSSIDTLPPGMRLSRTESVGTLPLPEEEVFARIAQQRGNGIMLVVNAVCATPVHLVQLQVGDAQDTFWHARHRIIIADAAALTLVEHHLALGQPKQFCNSVLHIDVGLAASLQHLRVQAGANTASLFQHSAISLQQDARCARLDLEVDASLSRHTLAITLAGQRAHAHANGLLFGDARRHLDTRLTVTHAAADTTCDLQWRGLATDQSRVAFHGGIVIESGADGSRADLSTRNLLLSEQAQVDAQPVLVIHTDDVQAAHGATVGQLDADALFYLRSRGIGEDAAKRMLTAAFCRDTLAALSEPSLHAIAEAAIEAALARMQNA